MGNYRHLFHHQTINKYLKQRFGSSHISPAWKDIVGMLIAQENPNKDLDIHKC